ncbi:MAG: limonene-1,2-epoxide hydrolase [Gammaproteobacteria bacterium]|nr:limonene-1,2-epoxide hydrolase [Gammaproteobacteria bacterium]
MTSDQTVTAFCSAINRSAWDEAVALLSDDCVYLNVPMEPAIVGPQGVRDTLQGFLSLLGSIRFEIQHQVATGNVVMNERIDHVTPPAGKNYGLPVVGVFEVRGDKICAWRDYFDIRQFETGSGLKLS